MGEELNEELIAKAGGERLDHEEGLKLKDKAWIETKKLWIVAGPAIFTRISTFGIHVITQAFIGHIGAIELAAYSLVSAVILRFATGIMLGMASALGTLCGQAYGAKQYHLLGKYLQRSWVVLLMGSIFLLPLFIFIAPILRALGLEDDIVKVAESISLWLIPVMFAFILSFTCQNFLQVQGKNNIIAFLAAVALLIHLFLSWLLTMKYKFGIPGAMASTISAYWLANLRQLLYATAGGCCETWKGFSLLAFKDLWPVVKLSLSSGVMLCVEFWYQSALVRLTGNLKNAEVSIDALSICLNINGWEMMISLGFLGAAMYDNLSY